MIVILFISLWKYNVLFYYYYCKGKTFPTFLFKNIHLWKKTHTFWMKPYLCIYQFFARINIYWLNYFQAFKYFGHLSVVNLSWRRLFFFYQWFFFYQCLHGHVRELIVLAVKLLLGVTSTAEMAMILSKTFFKSTYYRWFQTYIHKRGTAPTIILVGRQ